MFQKVLLGVVTAVCCVMLVSGSMLQQFLSVFPLIAFAYVAIKMNEKDALDADKILALDVALESQKRWIEQLEANIGSVALSVSDVSKRSEVIDAKQIAELRQAMNSISSRLGAVERINQGVF